MSVRHAAQPQFPLRGLREGPAAPWVRQKDWPELPWIPDDEQALVALIGVREGLLQRIPLKAGSAYTVDWGDGSLLEYVADSTLIHHEYDYSAMGGNISSEGYKFAVLKVTPQLGNSLFYVRFDTRPSGWNPDALDIPILDIQINSPYFFGMYFGNNGIALCRLHFRKNNLYNLENMFGGLYSLRDLVPFDTSLVTHSPLAFRYNYRLEHFPLKDFSKSANVSYLLYCGYALRKVEEMDLSAAVSATNMLSYCVSLGVVPDLKLGSLQNADYMFNCAFSLTEIGALDFSTVTTLTGAFTANYSLARVRITGIKVTVSFSGCNMQADALNEVFTNLASGVTGQTITVTGNPGASTCDPSIATAKGWTVAT